VEAMQDLAIVIDWRVVDAESGRWGHGWTYTLALYAILHAEVPAILYLGTADGTTVRTRSNATDKHERVWQQIEEIVPFQGVSLSTQGGRNAT
jgi:hypothetical protein